MIHSWKVSGVTVVTCAPLPMGDVVLGGKSNLYFSQTGLKLQFVHVLVPAMNSMSCRVTAMSFGYQGLKPPASLRSLGGRSSARKPGFMSSSTVGRSGPMNATTGRVRQ
jgi:hypothetical protein